MNKDYWVVENDTVKAVFEKVKGGFLLAFVDLIDREQVVLDGDDLALLREVLHKLELSLNQNEDITDEQ
jgi:hypothetical protein